MMVNRGSTQQFRFHEKRSHIIEKQANNTNANVNEDWLVERLADKLRKVSMIVQQSHIPHLLYRTTIEENEEVVKEEIGILSEKYIVTMIYVYGGFIPSSFQKIDVYALDKFTRRIIQKGKKDLLLQCLESLE
ncbi:MAG: hypothetical protein WB988_25175 [Candidatus Nitrosopolaris sp.]|jgi:hypothetical protein